MKKKIQHIRNRRAALSALAASRSQTAGDCLSAEQMAEMVENSCSEDQKNIYFNHVGTCDRCYEEWMTLRSSYLRRRSSSKIAGLFGYFSNRRGLYAAGSIVGGAAALLLFLNLHQDAVLVKTQDSAEFDTPPLREQPLSSAEGQIQELTLEDTADHIPAPAMMEADEERSKNDDVKPSSPMGRSKKIEKKEKAPFFHGETQEPGVGVQSSLNNGEDILQLLKNGCSADEKGEGFWQYVYNQLEIMPRDSVALPEGYRARIRNLVKEILNGAESHLYCDEIMAIVNTSASQ